ncbi:hypothetical protein STTU_0453 [Streptomyces sp. Tu6071]|nr:hypothetical protein STTU_0453 [Streptomyces sp. Tu6071]
MLGVRDVRGPRVGPRRAHGLPGTGRGRRDLCMGPPASRPASRPAATRSRRPRA